MPSRRRSPSKQKWQSVSGVRRKLRPLSVDERAAIDAARAEEGLSASAPEAIPRRAERTKAPLSLAQQRLWFVEQLVPGSAAYNIPVRVRLEGELDVAALEGALGDVALRHELLRSVIEVDDGKPRLRIAGRKASMPLTDLSAHPPETREHEAARLAREEARTPFDLERGPLLRARLLRLGSQSHDLCVTMAHIISDAWSFALFFRELSCFYNARVKKTRVSGIVELPVQYGDFAAWQRTPQYQEQLSAELAYWKRQLSGELPVLSLPTDRVRPPRPTLRGAWIARRVPRSTLDDLETLTRAQNATLFMVTLAAFQVLLHRYSGETDVIVGCPMTNRGRVELEHLIGCFVNTLAMRADLSGDPTFGELLGRVRETALMALSNQSVPFERIVDDVQPARDLSRNPIFQVAFVLQNTAQHASWRTALDMVGLSASPTVMPSDTAKFDLTLELEEEPDGLRVAFEYATDLFDEESIEALLEAYVTLLSELGKNLARPISELPLLTPARREELLVGWNDSGHPYPDSASVQSLFESWAERTPHATALLEDGRSLGYAELNRRANQLAHRLIREGVEPDVPIGVCMNRGFEQVIALLGILKAGGAYLPLDPRYPTQRLELMLKDARAPLVVCDEDYLPRLEETGAALFAPHTERSAIAAERDDNPGIQVGPDHLVYINYTSGSTGVPKGVAVRHSGVVRLVTGLPMAGLDANQTLLQHSPVHFDASTLELWGALLHGARTSLAPEGPLTVADLRMLIEQNSVSVLWLTASLFNLVVSEDASLLDGVRVVFTGGEALSVPHVKQALAQLPRTQIVNGYGPTETTTFASCHPIPRTLPEAIASIPIGRPIGNTRLFVLDARREPVPVGAPGELYIGGPGVARGYLNRPDLTEQRFVADPFSSDPHERLYRTGDRVRYLPDRNIEFLGRYDDQVKLRGHRIEPGEIAAALLDHPDVAEAVAVVRGAQSAARLVAYVVVAEQRRSPSAETLFTFLRERLPGYLVPSDIIFLESLPVTATGKLDVRSLPEAPLTARHSHPGVEPRNEVERRLAQLWREVLECEDIGVRDDFFELGGNSLVAVRLFARIRAEFAKDLPLATLFQAATIEHLASVLDAGQDTDSHVLVELEGEGRADPFYCVHGLGGEVMSYQLLAKHMAPHRPFFGLQALGLTEQTEPLDSIEKMATRYVDELRRHRPGGPYSIGGYSLGGSVAFEMARQLSEAGDRVDALVIIDHAPPNVRAKAGLPRRLGAMIRHAPDWLKHRIIEPGREEVQRVVARRLRIVARQAKGLLATGEVDALANVDGILHGSALSARYRRIYETSYRALLDYQVRPYMGKLVVVRSVAGGFARWPDADFGWADFALRGADVKLLPGGHGDILEPPHVVELASFLNEYLDRAQSASR